MTKNKRKSKKRYFLALFPGREYNRVSTNIAHFCRKQGLNSSHVSACLNHPDKRYSHRGFRFIWMDKRITKPKTATSYVAKYLNLMN